MKSDPQLRKNWDKLVKKVTGYLVCKRINVTVKPGNVEFDYIEATDTKKDCISNITYKNIIFPDMYGPVTLAIEFMNMPPLCQQLTATLFNLSGDPAYQREFQNLMLDFVPPQLMQS